MTNIQQKKHSSLTVFYKGEPYYDLNKYLAEKQKLTEAAKKKIVKLHEAKLDLFDKMRALNPSKDLAKLQAGAKKLEQLEFDMQATWGFSLDRNFHEWYEIPHCTCPKMDNQDYKGTNLRITVQGCPYHWRK